MKKAYDLIVLALSLKLAVIFLFLKYYNSYKRINDALNINLGSLREEIQDTGIILRPSLSTECDGDFDFVLDGKYSFEINEATYDTTPVIGQRFRTIHPNVPVFRNVLIQFSAAKELNLTMTDKKKGGFDILYNKKIKISASIQPRHTPIYIEANHLRKMSCTLGATSFKECVWSLSLSIWPQRSLSDREFTKLLHRLKTNRKASIVLDITMHIASSKTRLEIIKPRIGFACVDALHIQEEVKWLPVDGLKNCSEYNQALIVGGSPISVRNSSENGFISAMDDNAVQAANFAVRALTGKLRFNSIYLAFASNMTRARIIYECGNSKQCIHRKIQNNLLLLLRLKGIMEFEFTKLGLHHSLWNRVVLTEYCRLGGKGQRDGCKRLIWSGQRMWGEFAVAQMAYSHKWIGALDLDEFIGTHPALRNRGFFKPTINAVEFMDDLYLNSGKPDSIKLAWFNTFFESKAYDDITTAILSKKRAYLRIDVKYGNKSLKYDPSFTSCLRRLNQGKSFTKCTNIVSVGIHAPILLRNSSDITDITEIPSLRMKPTNSSLRVWEARGKLKFTNIDFCSLALVSRKDKG